MLTLILGGARSGKSDLAERLALASGRDVVFLATMDPHDDELTMRVERHRATRPASWHTVEESVDVVAALADRAAPGTFVVVDCMTLWVSTLLIAQLGDAEEASADATSSAIEQAIAGARALAAWAASFDGDVAIVSNDVGSGVVPAYPLGRAFRDALGGANSAVASMADRVYWVVAGLALELRSLGARELTAFGGAFR